MNRADWAWLMAAVIVGLFVGGIAILDGTSGGGSHQVTSYNLTIGTFEQRTVPAYTRRLTIETSGDTQKMLQTIHDIDPDCRTHFSADHPKVAPEDYAFYLFAGVLASVLSSFMFRIVVKICGRILGAKVDVGEIVKDPSVTPGQAQLAQDDRN